MIDISKMNSTPLDNTYGHLLHNPHFFWLVKKGYMDIFIVPIENQEHLSDPTCSGGSEHCFRAKVGNMVFGTPAWESQKKANGQRQKMVLRGVPQFHSEIIREDIRNFINKDFDLTTVKYIDSWIQMADQAMSRSFLLPRKYELLEADPQTKYLQGTSLSANYLDIIWVQAQESSLLYCGEQSLSIPKGNFYPITHWATLELTGDSLLNGYHTPEMMLRDDFRDIFHTYQSFFMEVMSFNFFAQATRSQNLQENYLKMANTQKNKILNLLSSTAQSSGDQSKTHPPPKADSHLESLSQICTRVMEEWGIDVTSSQQWQDHDKHYSLLETLERMGFGVRKVNLHDWNYSKSMAGYLMGSEKDGKAIVGFFPPHGDRKHYLYFNPQKGEERKLRDVDIANSSFRALLIYPPLPNNIRNLKNFFSYILKGKQKDIKTMSLIIAVNTVFFILMPLLAGKILTQYIPNHNWNAFALALSALFIAGLAGFLLCIISSLLYIAISGTLLLYIQTHLWKKIITLPVRFFQRHSIGEILDRMNSITIVSGMLNVSLIQYLSAFISGIIGLILLFYYDAVFTLILLAIITFLIVIDYFLFRKILSLEDKSHALEFKINDFVLQAINALSKIRVARREQFVLFHWAKNFCSKRKLRYRIHLLRSFYQVLHSHFIFYSNIALFLIMVYGRQEFILEYYIVFNMVLAQFSFSINQISALISMAFGAIPFITKIRPIISAEASSLTHNIHPETIRGRIEFSHVYFSYRTAQGNLTPVLKDVSFTINPGEYVAIVGSSGSGKSTIVRLILGLENLQSGSIHIDQYNLEELNLQSLREQVGSVLQSTQILPTNVIKNIAMGAEQEEEQVTKIYKQVWWSLSQASLEKDIAKMPMGLHTSLGQGNCISGGQRQRLLIARALNKNPRILLFDEATSAMDNITQENIKTMLDNLNITRIIIAHRLSTITNVNRIIMLKDGKIVEQGSYQRLLQAGGEFAQFAKRQFF